MSKVSIPNDILLQETARLIADGHTVTHLVRGNSMNPFLVDRRDKVVIAPYRADELKPGVFVLALDTTGRYVLHRIIARRGEVLVLMGDGNVAGTELATPGGVVGVVREVIRKEKTYSCTGWQWRWYSALWMRLRPVRRYVLGAWRRLRLS